MPHYSHRRGGGAYQQQTGGHVLSSNQGRSNRAGENLLPGHVVDGRLIEGGFHVRGTHPDDPPALDTQETPR